MEYNKEQLYQVCKILAESDSIAEGHNYCYSYERKRFEKEFEEDEYGYVTIAKEIIDLLKV